MTPAYYGCREKDSNEKRNNSNNDMDMKINRIPTLLSFSKLLLAASAVVALTFMGDANAQNKAASDDGIAASPKVRQTLTERKASANPAAAPVSTMSCPKCAEVLATQPNRQAKGAEVLVGAKTAEIRHTCSGCEVKWTVAGEGKAKHTVATHTCSADVPNNKTCCAAN